MRRKSSAVKRRSGGRRRAPAFSAAFLAGLSSDWYWEQDAELRFTRVESRNRTPDERARVEAVLGKRRWEAGFETEGGWDAHRAALGAREPFRDLVVWRYLDDGSPLYASVSGEPMFDRRGRFTGYRGVARDITRQRRAEDLLRLEHRVNRILASAGEARDTLAAALGAICETQGWDYAEHWKLDEAANVLRRHAYWIMPGIVDALEFARGSADVAFEPGAGLVGAVWQSGDPIWVADAAAEPRVLRKDLLARTGLAAALVLPVHSGDRVVGVLAFSRRTMRAPDKRLMQALGVIAGQIGHFLQRAEAEQAMRESEARFRSLTDLSSDWYWEQDADFRFTRLEGRMVAGGDDSLRKRLIGKRRWETGLDIEGGWQAHRALLASRRPYHDVLMWRTMDDGHLRYVSVSGEPIFDAAGRFGGYRGVGRDVTAQKRAEALLRLEHEVAAALARAEDTASGLAAVMRAICEAEGWSCSRYLRLEGGLLVFQQAWSAPGAAHDAMLENSRSLAYRPGEGLAGIALQSGEPVWTADVRNDPRVHQAALAGVTETRGVFGFPVLSGGRIIGVFTFSSTVVRKPDERLLQASRVIGSHVGQFLQRKQAEASLRESEARFRSLTQMSSDFFWETDAAHRISSLVHGPNYPAAYMGRGVIGKMAWEVPSVSPDDAGWAEHRAALDARVPFRDFEFGRRTPDGGTRYFSVSGEPHFADDGRFLGYRGVGRDITEVVLARERIASLAYTDALTGLANRASLVPSLEQAVQRARRRSAKLAVVFLDLDGFKEINDAYGHDAGDALLVELANRLRENLRASDLIARLGGDEFLVVLEEIPDAGPVEIVARKLLGEVARPYALPGGRALVTASIGISLFPDDAADASALMKHADTAMYAAKQSGKNTYRFYAAVPAANDARAPQASSGTASSA